MRSEDRKPAVALAEDILIWIVGHIDYSSSEIKQLKERWRDLLIQPPEQKEADSMWKVIEDARRKITGRRK